MATLYTDLAPHTKLFEEIMEWGEEQEEKINWAWQSPGGWEGWAQVELHFLFPDTTREDRAYRMPDGKTPFRTDLALKEGEYLMGSYSSDPVQERVLLELKCEGAKNRGNFKANVQKDLIKSSWISRMSGGNRDRVRCIRSHCRCRMPETATCGILAWQISPRTKTIILHSAYGGP